MPVDLADLVTMERPEWHERAACRGMTTAFTSAELEDQIAVCDGTTAPWARPCEVREQCLLDFVERHTEGNGGIVEACCNATVHGGRTPNELVQICRSVKKGLADARREVRENGGRGGLDESRVLEG